jgi:hypothetical protein
MPGDAILARREWEALIGSPGKPLDQSGLAIVLGARKLATSPVLTTDFPWVAVTWERVSFNKLVDLLRRSAFAQEVFISSPLSSTPLAKLCPRVGRIATEAAEYAPGTVVCLAHNYVVESESALPSEVAFGRVDIVVRSLLLPFENGKQTPLSRKLRSAKKTTLSLSHDLHIYKAKFFPRMVRALINIFGHDKTVFDPYCGSGTALLEAALLGQDAIGADIDPICRMISASKITPFLERPDETREALLGFRSAIAQKKESMGFTFPAELSAKIRRRDRIDGTAYLPIVQQEASIVASALESSTVGGVIGDLIKTLASDAVTKKIRYRFIGVGNGKYTIEIIKQSLLERLKEKIERALQLIDVFSDLKNLLHVSFGSVTVKCGDARTGLSWPALPAKIFVPTSPPYLPASSGREHYSSSRALAFAVLGLRGSEAGYFDTNICMRPESVLGTAPEANRLMAYLLSDASEDADPQRDAMRFERKAIPTAHYLADIERFGDSLVQTADSCTLALVVADKHTFYSHKRSEIEHVVDCALMYSEILAKVGIKMEEEIELQLLKSAASRAKPRSTDDYHEAVLVCRVRGKPVVHEASQSRVGVRRREDRVPA